MENLQQLEALVASAPLAMVVVNAAQCISIWNHTAERVLGLPSEVVQGRALATADEPLLREIHSLYKQLCANVPLNHFSTLLERPDGSLADVTVTAIPLTIDEHGQASGMIAFISDVTEQRRLELARQENEIKLSAITANLPGAVFQILFHLRERSVIVPYISDGAQRLFGISAEAFIEQPKMLTALLHPDDRESFREGLARAATHHDTFLWEGKFLSAGQPRWLYFAATPRLVEIDYTVWDGIIIDITQQKSAEQSLQASQDELRALSTHMETVKETERADIAREIHDDLGGTLTKLKTDVLQIRKRLALLTPTLLAPAVTTVPEIATTKRDTLRHPISDIEDTLSGMQQLLDQAVTSTTRIARSLRPAILDLGIIPALEWEIGEFRRRHAVDVTFTCNLEDLALDSQPSTVLYRVVQEALTNILKHAQATVVAVELFATEDRITLEIHDNGIGIPDAALAKPNSFGVRGMNERARMLSGWLDISSAPGKGTTLMLSIPHGHHGETNHAPPL